MKKIMLMCCFLIGISAVSRAQNGGGGMRMNPAERAKQLQKKLSLTDDQTAKITAIYQDAAAKRDSVKNAGGDMRSAMMPMMMATNQKVKAVLTADQNIEYDKMMKERMDRMRQGGGMGNGNTPPATPSN